MDAQWKAKWLAALRSGEFKQGKGALHEKKKDAYCCLGVLCKISGSPVFVDYAPNSEARESDFTAFGTMDSFSTSSLPKFVKDLTGVEDSYGCYTVHPEDGDPFEESLAHLNDIGATFEEIADIIEREF